MAIELPFIVVEVLLFRVAEPKLGACGGGAPPRKSMGVGGQRPPPPLEIVP